MTKFWLAGTAFVAVSAFASAAEAAPACDADNGGLTLPKGFCAELIAHDLGTLRHITVAPNGDVYVGIQSRTGLGGGALGLRDTTGDGRLDTKVSFGEGSTTGVGIYDGYVYLARTDSVVRFKLTPGQLKPTGAEEVVVSGMVAPSEHHDKGIAFDGKGAFYINVGPPSNACQVKDRTKGSPGQDPCPLLPKFGGVWKFNANKLNQTQADGDHTVTGLREALAITYHDGAPYVVMNNRDQLDLLYPQYFTQDDNNNRPAEVMYRGDPGSNFGWPYCFYDFKEQKLLLNPEYGGDGKKQGRCATSGFGLPVAAFPAHWAPMAVTFYEGKQFPAHYRGGAFIAFHGSWNRAPQERPGAVVFQPFSGDKASGKFEIFASGFTKEPVPNQSAYTGRPNGVAVGPDGSLYVTDSVKGKIWRIFYKG